MNEMPSSPERKGRVAALAAAIERARRSRALLVVLSCALVLFAFLVRLGHVPSGLPYIHNGDEPRLASGALDMLKTGDYTPPDFHYGSVTIYLNLAVDTLQYLRLSALPEDAPEFLDSTDDIQTGADSGWRWEVSHPSFLFLNRSLAALLGAGAVLLTMLMTRPIAGAWGALLAGALVAGLDFHIQQSAMVTADVPSSFFTLSAVLLSIGYLRSGRPGHLALALLIAGLAGSTKYNQAVAVVAPAVAFFAGLPRHGHQPWLWVALIVLPVAGFLLGSPYALLDVPMYLHYAGWEAFHYKTAGQVRFTVEAGWPHVWLQLGRMSHNVGLLVSLFALLGTALLGFRKLGFAYLAFPIAYIAFFCSMRLDFHRNFVVVYPFLAMAFAFGVARCWRWTRAHASLARQQGLDVVLSAALLVFGASYLAGAARDAWISWRLPESRSAAMQLTAQLVAERGFQRVGVAAELRLHRLDLLRVPLAEVRPLEELLATREQYDALVVPRRLFETTARSERLHAQMRALNLALPTTPILAEVAGGGTNPAHPSLNPAVRVLGRPGEAQGAILRAPSAGDLAQEHIHDVDEQ